MGTVTIGAVLFLILVGGVVRSTGSGMGCPDWPKCFGSWVPPTEVSQIPDAFFQNHPEYQTQTFNVAQTWTEYVNRLVGALIGLFVFATAVLSLIYLKKDRRIFWLSALAVILTGFQGWLGKIVVDRNLSGGMVTIHMFVALIILMVLIVAVYFSYTGKAGRKPAPSISTGQNWLGFGVMIITMAQILIGTQVRENVDEVSAAMEFAGRETWIDQLGGYYSIHKVLWILVTLALVVWVKNLLQSGKGNRLIIWMSGLALAGVLLEVLLGISLAGMALPPWMQPLHLLIANIIFAAEFCLLIYCVKLEQIGKPKIQLSRANPASFES